MTTADIQMIKTNTMQCSAMDGGGENSAKCRVCPNKCFWRQHMNNPYYFEWYEETETKTW